MLTTGGVRCWGQGIQGELGDGSTSDRLLPLSVDVLTDVNDIDLGGNHTCAVLTTGGLRCWGSNTYGQLGDGTTTDRHTPVAVNICPP